MIAKSMLMRPQGLRRPYFPPLLRHSRRGWSAAALHPVANFFWKFIRFGRTLGKSD